MDFNMNDIMIQSEFTLNMLETELKILLKEYEVENNPVLSFIEDQGKESIVNELTDDVFTRYQVFCAENGLQAGSKLTFSKQINRVLGTVSKQSWVNGKNRKIFQLP